VVVHPIALRYWFLEDPQPAIADRLTRLERMLRWNPKTAFGLVDRLLRINEALLAVKEIEYYGAARSGDLDVRIRGLAEFLISREEARQSEIRRNGPLIERIRAVRAPLVKSLVDAPAKRGELLTRLDDLLTAELLYGQDQSYLLERPTVERLADAILRTEEDVFDTDSPVAKMGAVLEVGPAINVRETPPARGDCDPLIATSEAWIRRRLDETYHEGPPAGWGLPRQDLVQTPRIPSAANARVEVGA
jgi:hypothetical protein